MSTAGRKPQVWKLESKRNTYDKLRCLWSLDRPPKFSPLKCTILCEAKRGFFELVRCHLINIVLFPMQRWIGLNDDALVRGVLEFFDQRGFARLQRLGDLR